MLKITPGQEITLEFIHHFTMANGYPPTIQEIAGDRGVAGNAAQEHVAALTKKLYLSKKAGKARSIVLTELGKIHVGKQK